MTTLTLVEQTIPGARPDPENPLPFFRSPDPDRNVDFDEAVPAGKRSLAGWQAGFRVLPYRMQDSYSRSRELLRFETVVLENEYLTATFLPEMGGRLLSLIYRPENRELLSRNAIFQPANLAIRNAWFAGGVEWNIGHLGHTFTTCSPVFAARIRGAQGEPGLRLYEYERCKGYFWQVDFYLPPGSPFLLVYYRVIHPGVQDNSMYWWTNIAVPERPGTRVLAPGKKVIYIRPGSHSFGYADMPYLPSTPGKDSSYPTNFHFSSEYFFQLDGINLPWEASLDEQGSGLIEASTPRLAYRKMFCWGMHPGGRRWQNFLCGPGGEYVEIQAGLAPTQVHGLSMPAGTTWDWVQAFGFFQGDPQRVHDPDYERAAAYVDAQLKQRLPAAALAEYEQRYRERAGLAPEQVLKNGSGWGALELLRRNKAAASQPISQGLAFPDETLGPEQARWAGLLNQHSFPAPDPAMLPGDWMVQEEWQALLAALPEKNWFSLLHEGNMEMEQGHLTEAVRCWEESLRHNPSAWAHRNLAVACQRQNQPDLALDHYRSAWDALRGRGSLPAALAVEILQSLVSVRQFDQAMQVYNELPAGVQQYDRVQILLGRIALERDDLDTVEQVLQHEYAVILEGEVELTNLWFGMWERRTARETGRPMDDTLRAEVRRRYPPPASIDYRMG